jgi:hypothetical protein
MKFFTYEIWGFHGDEEVVVVWVATPFRMKMEVARSCDTLMSYHITIHCQPRRPQFELFISSSKKKTFYLYFKHLALVEKLIIALVVKNSPHFWKQEVYHHDQRSLRMDTAILLTVADFKFINKTDLNIYKENACVKNFRKVVHQYDEVKKKLPLCFSWAPHHKGILGEWRYSFIHPLTSALDGGECSASRPGRFTPRESVPITHRIGGWVVPRIVLDAVMKRKIPSTSWESIVLTLKSCRIFIWICSEFSG